MDTSAFLPFPYTILSVREHLLLPQKDTLLSKARALLQLLPASPTRAKDIMPEVTI
jgi:hypothetical protein